MAEIVVPESGEPRQQILKWVQMWPRWTLVDGYTQNKVSVGAPNDMQEPVGANFCQMTTFL